MAGVKISQLQDGGALQATDAFPVARGSLTRKILGAQLLDPLQSLDTRLNALSADVFTTTRNISAINVVDSPTIDLDWNASTRTLSARVIPLALPTTEVFEMFSTIGTSGGSYLPWGAAYEGTNPAYPGGRQAIYNSSRMKHLSSETFVLIYDSNISITDVAYWNWNGPVHSSSSDSIFIWQTYDYSIDNGLTWVGDMSANTGTVKVINSGSYYGATVPNSGASGTGTVFLTAGAGTQIKFKPKYRFQKLVTHTGLNVDDMTGYGSHTVTIQPLINY